jgi:hypothetical protein
VADISAGRTRSLLKADGEITGGAALLAVFEKCACEMPTPSGSYPAAGRTFILNGNQRGDRARRCFAIKTSSCHPRSRSLLEKREKGRTRPTLLSSQR